MKAKMKHIICFLLFCGLLVGTGKFFRYLLVDDTASYTRITFHEMYEQDNIDVLFVGSSHCDQSFIPDIFDEKLGLNTFNGGTSAQHPDGSYLVIKEAAKYNEIKQIYLELYFGLARHNYKDRTELTQFYIIADYLRPSIDKTLYLLSISPKEYYSNNFILARRYWTKFFDADYVKDVLIKKNTNAYKNYEYISNGTSWYYGKGYLANSEKDAVRDWNFFDMRNPSTASLGDVSQDWVDSLEDIISFCEKKNIQLTLVSAPMSNYHLVRQGNGNYDKYITTVQNLIAGTDVRYYDFNLCKETYIPNSSELFKDAGHMNYTGAKLFSTLFADFLNGEIPENELFWDSYVEKLAHLEPTVFGVSYYDSQTDNDEALRHCEVIATPDMNLEYEIILSPAEGEPYKLQDFSANRFFTLQPDEHGTVTVTYRPSSSPKETATCNITY